jgi:ubiquinone biosynthesis protein
MYKNSVKRFREIVRVLAYYGFGFIVDNTLKKSKEKSPQNLRKACIELGPTFIKIGQILSTRPDLLSQNYIDELSKLQDNVPAESFDSINKVFNNEFNKSIDESFQSFDMNPLASASIAQAHCAKLKDGRNVIVKIQRPKIKEKMEMDISILSKLFSLTRAKFSELIIDPQEALDELRESTSLELDFENEAKNIKLFKRLNENVAFLHTPYVVDELSGLKILTMEKIEGFKINNKLKLKEGDYDLDDLGKKLALSFCKQIFDDSFFHADPHPGNIFIKEGKICFIDFGIMGTLSKSLKEALNELVIAMVYKDINKIISVLMSIAIKTGYVNRNTLYEDLDYLMASYMSTSLKNIKMSSFLEEIFNTSRRNNLKIPRDLTLLIRSMVIAEGVVAEISPDINFLDVAVPYIKSSTKDSILKDLDPNELAMRYLRFAKDSSKVPSKFIELSDSILNGRAKMQLDVNGLEHSVNQLNKMINRIVFAVIISSMIIGSSFILNSNVGPTFYDISIIGITGYIIAAFMGFWLIISIIKSGKL